jgi:xanthine dehydrogenase molybdenum-binding subunit
VDIWISNKGPFAARSQFAEAVGLSPEHVRFNTAAIGGDFGGKGDLMDSVLAYHLAKASGRPVKMAMTYAEELTAGNPRHAALITIRSGVTNDGHMTARQAKIIFNSGAYAAFKPLHTIHGSVHAGGPYRVDNVDIECLVVYTNSVPCGHMRSPGGPQVVFALESHIDIIAHEMGIDALEFRLRNALREGDVAPLGERYHDILCSQTLQAAADAAGWGSDKEPWVGRGIAMYERPAGGGASSATLTVGADGRFSLLAAIPDTGTGSYTILQQIVAEELQVPLESVTVSHGGTAVMPFDWGVGASRVTHTAGKAAALAAREVKEALVEAAARALNALAEQVRWQGGSFVADRGADMSLSEVLAHAERLGETPISRTATYSSSGNYQEDVTSYAAQIAEVEVDPETGQVKLRNFFSAHDAGIVLNPLTHQGQIDGGVVQGFGQALIEHLQIEDGVVGTANLGDYKLPSIADIPDLETVLIQTESGPTPYGGKAIGELSNVAVPAAIANAVFDATGVRFMELPITAEKVYEALQAANETH